MPMHSCLFVFLIFFSRYYRQWRSHRMVCHRQSAKECYYAFNVSPKKNHSFHLQCTIRTYFSQIAQHFMNFKMEFNCSSATFPCSWFFCMWIWHYFVVHFRFSVPNVTMYLHAFFPLDIWFFRLILCSI